MKGDRELLKKLHKEVSEDPNPPSLTQDLDPFDPVSVELILLESDAYIDTYMTKFRSKYQSQFNDPTLFDTYVLELQIKARKVLKEGIANAQQEMSKQGWDSSIKNPFEDIEDNNGE